MRKYIFIGLSYGLVVIPGALNAWLSLIARFTAEDRLPITISTPFWYQSLFPILGLGVLLIGIWWTSDKDKEKEIESAERIIHGSVQLERASTLQPEIVSEPEPTSAPEVPAAPKLVRILTPEADETEPNSLPPILLEATAADLVGIFKGRTAIQAQPLVDEQIGNLVRIQGIVRDVRENRNEGHTVVLSESTDESRGGPLIFASLDNERSNEISSLTLSQEITVLGRLTEVDQLSISLESCSLGRGLKG